MTQSMLGAPLSRASWGPGFIFHPICTIFTEGRESGWGSWVAHRAGFKSYLCSQCCMSLFSYLEMGDNYVPFIVALWGLGE